MHSEHDSLSRSSERLARLVSAADSPEGEWRSDELGAILTHQLHSPVEFELEGDPPSDTPIDPEACDLGAIQNFEDLFQHPTPPLALLRLTKEFAKAHLAHPETTLVKEVATALYYASIALALMRHNVRITRLGDRELRKGIKWCLAQDWMEPNLRRLFQETAHRLTS